MMTIDDRMTGHSNGQIIRLLDANLYIRSAKLQESGMGTARFVMHEGQ